MEQGRRIGERYELVERIGSGGMASVWRAQDHSLGREVAVKLLHPSLAEATDHERFRREARNAASLSHPHIVTIYDTGEDDGRPYIVMELIQGRTLHDVLREQGPLSVAGAAQIGRGALAALAEAHRRGLVHRDVKPGNILLTHDGDVKVTDFGIAKGLSDVSGLTQTGTLVGTASYLSPEQVDGRDIGPQADLYALGCVLYECLAGTPPFRADTPVATAVQHRQDPVPDIRARRSDVPDDLAGVLERALEKDPAARYSSAAEMDAAIAATGLAEGPDATPAFVFAADDATVDMGAAPTAAMGGHATTRVQTGPGATEAIRTPEQPPDRMRRLVVVVGAILLVATAALIGAFLVTNGDFGGAASTPEPSLTPSAPAVVAPVEENTPEPSPSPSPSPSPTPTPEPQEDRTPRPPRTPNFDLPAIGDGEATPEASSPTPSPPPE